MSDLNLTEAIEAAQRDDVPLSVIVTAVTRATPHIERQVRKRIDAELDALPFTGQPTYEVAIERCRRIVRGEL